MTSASDATITIPQFGHTELTLECLRTLRCHDPVRWPVVVVDDGSPAKDRLRVTADCDENVQLVVQDHAGVTATWNRGALAARTEFFVFLNNDVVSTGPFVERLLAPLRSGNACVSGVRLRRETALPADVLARLPTPEFLEGWCFAVAAKDFHRVGGFDERMRLYFSDTDFQGRVLIATEKHRARLAAVGDALPLRHLGHRTAHDGALVEDRREIWTRDRQTFVQKWRGDFTTETQRHGEEGEGTR